MPLHIKTFAVLIFCLFSANSSADDLIDMLTRMSEANQNQNYQGIFILRKSDKLSTLQVTHGVDGEGAWESLESINGEPRKVIRRNKQVVSVFPNRKLVTIRQMDDKRSLHPQLPGNMDQLTLFYSMDRLRDDRIANRQTLVIDLMPKDQYRYGYRYWVDKETGMLLRCDLFDEDKTVVEQMMFTSLRYLSEAPVETFNIKDYENYKLQQLDVPEASQHINTQQWTVNRLPKGFMLTQSVMRKVQPQVASHSNAIESAASATIPAAIPAEIPDTQLPGAPPSHNILPHITAANAVTDAASIDKSAQPKLLHMVYSDGLASVSVFIEKNQGAGNHLQGASSMGAVNAFGHLVKTYFVTVVGEVPAKTVKAMAQSTIKIPQAQLVE